MTWQTIETAPREGAFVGWNRFENYGETWLAESYWRAVENEDDGLHDGALALTDWAEVPS
jgi:hypothetical protein